VRLLPSSVARPLRLFFGRLPRLGPAVVVFALGSSLADSLGIALFVPVLTSPSALDGDDRMARILRSLLDMLGLPNSFNAVLVLMALIFLIRGALKLCETWARIHASSRIVSDLRAELIDAYIHSRYASFRSFPKGKIETLLSHEANQARLYINSLSMSLANLLAASIYLACSIVVGWKISLMALAAGLLATLGFRALSRISFRLSHIRSALYVQTTQLIMQVSTSFKYLRIVGGTPAIHTRARRLIESLFRVEQTQGMVNGIVYGLNQPVSVIILIGLIYYFVSVLGENMSVLLLSMGLLYKTMNSLMNCQIDWNNLSMVRSSIDSIDHALRQLRESSEHDGTPRRTQVPAASIELNEVHLRIDGKVVLRDINLKIGTGDFVAFVGASGSGKSSLLDLLSGLSPPSSGRIRVDGHDTASLLGPTGEGGVGLVTQNPVSFSDTVLNNITLWRNEASDTNVRQAAELALKQAEAWDFVEQLPNGLDTMLGEGGVTLSEGQKQRLALARELYRKPRLLFLDEATSALDMETDRRVQRSLRTLRPDLTLISVTHRSQGLEDFDVIHVLRDGTIVESGSYVELLARPDSELRHIFNQPDQKPAPAQRVLVASFEHASFEEGASDRPVTREILNISESGIALALWPNRDPLTPGALFQGQIILQNCPFDCVLQVVHVSNAILGCRFVNPPAALQEAVAAFIKTQLEFFARARNP
jgi:ABC-type multidrug transport system fused ATPase/permease subunit